MAIFRFTPNKRETIHAAPGVTNIPYILQVGGGLDTQTDRSVVVLAVMGQGLTQVTDERGGSVLTVKPGCSLESTGKT